MIIPGNALLALLSSPQDLQGTREEEGNFGALLTAIESHATSLPDQEEAERRALDSVLQGLMSMFQSCTPANCLPAASAPGTGESGAVRIQPVAGLAGYYSGLVRPRAGRHRRDQPATWYSIRRSQTLTNHLLWADVGTGVPLPDSKSAGKRPGFFIGRNAPGLEWIFHGPANGGIVRLHRPETQLVSPASRLPSPPWRGMRCPRDTPPPLSPLNTRRPWVTGCPGWPVRVFTALPPGASFPTFLHLHVGPSQGG
jgi:hypothetical protein